MREHQIEVNGIKLQVREYVREAEVIIFLHFGGGNLMMWEGVLPHFQDRYYLITIDLRGHGKSDSPKTGYHIDQMAADVVGIMERLNVPRAHIVGSSLGAEVGLSMAANYPERVKSLVCEGALYSEFGPFSVRDETEKEFKERVTSRLTEIRDTPEELYATSDELIRELKKEYEEYDWWNERIEALERYNICETADGQYAQNWRKWVLEDYMQHYFDYRFEDYYLQVKCPVLMLPGEDEAKDENHRAAMQRLSQLVDSCQIVDVPGWVHAYGWLLDPEPLSGAVLEFYESIKEKND
jgi:2-succinyl-6-hydroxy-2,4-cyclohexadiene-1-carboxylate synthase